MREKANKSNRTGKGTDLPAMLTLLFMLVAADVAIAEGVVKGGRIVDPNRDFEIRGVIGSVTEMQGFVQETTRAFYDATDQQFKQDLAERFDLDDFDMDGGFLAIGVATENIWKYFTLQFELLFMNPETDAVAQRNYYIAVDSVSFNGQEFENQQIPAGTPFTAEIFGALTQINGLFTPITIQTSESFRFTPWIGIGFFGFFGEYEIDAGPARGVVQYQFPPENFVVGGTSDGYIGAGLPEIGIGGELMFGDDEGVNVVLQGHIATFQYEGSTSYFTSSSRRDKDADIDHVHGWLQGSLEFPLESGRALTVGGKLDMIQSEVEILSEPGTTEEIIARRERFDKRVDFEMTTATAFIGVTF
jgi:hypothetical protein